MIRIHLDNGEVIDIPNFTLQEFLDNIEKRNCDLNIGFDVYTIPKVAINVYKINYIEEIEENENI